jgi:stage II sporulation protein D
MEKIGRRPGVVRRAAALLSIALAASILSGCGVTPPHGPQTRLSLPAVIRVRYAGKIVDVPVEQYVLGSVLAEASPAGEAAPTVDTVFEVQALVARSYAASHLGRHRAEGFDLCDGTHCQLYDAKRIRTSTFAAAAERAVRKTAGQIVAYGVQPVEALFHADCGGRTAAAEDVWGGTGAPYLLSAPDSLPSGKHRSWQVAVPLARMVAALNNDPRTQVGRRLTRLRVAQRDTSGRAALIEIVGDASEVVRGEEFRSAVNQRLGDKTLQSTRFTIRETNAGYVFDGTGYGHGVGLCQLGALSRARNGATANQIVAAYFHGAKVVSVPN